MAKLGLAIHILSNPIPGKFSERLIFCIVSDSWNVFPKSGLDQLVFVNDLSAQNTRVFDQFDATSLPSCNVCVPLSVDANLCHQIAGLP